MQYDVNASNRTSRKRRAADVSQWWRNAISRNDGGVLRFHFENKLEALFFASVHDLLFCVCLFRTKWPCCAAPEGGGFFQEPPDCGLTLRGLGNASEDVMNTRIN